MVFESIAKYKHSKRNAICYKDQVISYSQMIENIESLALYFSKYINQKSTLVMVLKNIPENIYTFYACNKIGVIVDNIPYILDPVMIFHYLKKNKTKICVIQDYIYIENVSLFSSLDCKFILCTTDKIKNKKYKYMYIDECFYKKSEYTLIDEQNKASFVSTYIHTGGTTGSSKVVAISQNSMCNIALSVEKIFSPEDYQKNQMIVLGVLPLFHGFGLGVAMHSMLSMGSCIILIETIEYDYMIEQMIIYKCNLLLGVPNIYEKLFVKDKFIKEVIPNIKHCYVGGESVQKQLIEKYDKLFSLHKNCAFMNEGYGLSETITVCIVNKNNDRKVSSIGKPLFGVSAIIVDENNNVLEKNSHGELLVSTPYNMVGYLKEESPTVSIDGKEYIKTGDICYQDDDGFFYYVTRKKRIAKIASHLVILEDLEKFVNGIESIDKSLCCEIIKDSKTFLRLYLIASKIKFSNNEIKKIIKDNFNKYYVPTEIVYVKEFKITKVGKIDYVEMSKGDISVNY